jgi:hypothetical protein
MARDATVPPAALLFFRRAGMGCIPRDAPHHINLTERPYSTRARNVQWLHLSGSKLM